jgi:glutathione synthase
MDLLVVMDRLDDGDQAGDTSVGLMAAALERGHRVLHCTSGDLSLVAGRVSARARTVTAGGRIGLADEVLDPVDLAEIDAVLVRTDPPVGADYLAMTLLLEFARGRTLIVNDPRALRESNEKLYACRFPDLMPETVVTADEATLLGFADEHHGAVLKPLDGHGGHGVCLLRPDDPDGPALVADRTGGGLRPVMAQRFLAGVFDGDRRILLLDGRPLGVLRRRPTGGDFRANIGLGGAVDVVALDPSDRRIVDALAPSLRADGLWFVGIDVIDGHLSEVNVTSPTGLRQLGRLSGTRPDLEVVDWVAERARTSWHLPRPTGSRPRPRP